MMSTSTDPRAHPDNTHSFTRVLYASFIFPRGHQNRSSVFWSACLSSTAHALQSNEQISNLGCFDVTNSPFVHFFLSSASINKTVTGLCTFLLDKNVYHECTMLPPDLLTKKARQPSVRFLQSALFLTKTVAEYLNGLFFRGRWNLLEALVKWSENAWPNTFPVSQFVGFVSKTNNLNFTSILPAVLR